MLIFVSKFFSRNYLFPKSCFCYVILQKLLGKTKKRQKAEGLRLNWPYNHFTVTGEKKYMKQATNLSKKEVKLFKTFNFCNAFE